MLKAIQEIAIQVMTEPNNKTTCPVRVLAVLGTVQGLALVGYQVVVKGTSFNLQEYGIGLGVLLAALGAALSMKKDSQ